MVLKKPKVSQRAITMRVAKNILMQKVLVSFGGPYLDDKDLVILLGEFIVVASPNIKNCHTESQKKVHP